jgi:predicted small metal-binding protein
MSKNNQKSTDKNAMPDTPSTNPSVNPQTGAVNPSAPTVGTEQWGNTSDERRVLGQHEPANTRSGQMKGNPGDNMTAASQREEQRATTNKRRDDSNQADLSSRTTASAHSMNTSHGGADRTFRCADVGNSDCQWETSGADEEEVMRHMEEHWRRDHAGMSDWTEAMRNKVRDSIHRREAA